MMSSLSSAASENNAGGVNVSDQFDSYNNSVFVNRFTALHGNCSNNNNNNNNNNNQRRRTQHQRDSSVLERGAPFVGMKRKLAGTMHSPQNNRYCTSDTTTTTTTTLNNDEDDEKIMRYENSNNYVKNNKQQQLPHTSLQRQRARRNTQCHYNNSIADTNHCFRVLVQLTIYNHHSYDSSSLFVVGPRSRRKREQGCVFRTNSGSSENVVGSNFTNTTKSLTESSSKSERNRNNDEDDDHDNDDGGGGCDADDNDECEEVYSNHERNKDNNNNNNSDNCSTLALRDNDNDNLSVAAGGDNDIDTVEAKSSRNVSASENNNNNNNNNNNQFNRQNARQSYFQTNFGDEICTASVHADLRFSLNVANEFGRGLTPTCLPREYDVFIPDVFVRSTTTTTKLNPSLTSFGEMSTKSRAESNNGTSAVKKADGMDISSALTANAQRGQESKCNDSSSMHSRRREEDREQHTHMEQQLTGVFAHRLILSSRSMKISEAISASTRYLCRRTQQQEQQQQQQQQQHQHQHKLQHQQQAVHNPKPIKIIELKHFNGNATAVYEAIHFMYTDSFSENFLDSVVNYNGGEYCDYCELGKREEALAERFSKQVLEFLRFAEEFSLVTMRNECERLLLTKAPMQLMCGTILAHGVTKEMKCLLSRALLHIIKHANTFNDDDDDYNHTENRCKRSKPYTCSTTTTTTTTTKRRQVLFDSRDWIENVAANPRVSHKALIEMAKMVNAALKPIIEAK